MLGATDGLHIGLHSAFCFVEEGNSHPSDQRLAQNVSESRIQNNLNLPVQK